VQSVVRGLFVTGTDTGVGKTVVCAALMHRYRPAALVRYWKPIQTGIEQDDDTRDVVTLGGCQATEVFARGIRLRRPLSPHLAARLNETTISIESLIHEIESEPEHYRWIIEGAGGVLVPVNDRHTMADLMVQVGLPVIVAARSGLGTINHTLLTIEALRHRHLHVAGVVLVGERHGDNRVAIEQYGSVAVVGEMPRFAELTPAALAAWSAAQLDRDGRLLESFR
jgi:dethiobiotin synthase